MTRPHVVIVSREVAPLVGAGGIGRHVAFAARALRPVADVTVVLPSGLAEALKRQVTAGGALLGDDALVRAVVPDPEWRACFASPFHADAAEVASFVAEIAGERSIDLIEVDDYLGLGAVLVDAWASRTGAGPQPDLVTRLHGSWEMTRVLDRQPMTTEDARWIAALERRGLRRTGRLLAPSATASTYRRFYGRDALAASVVLPPAPVAFDAAPAGSRPRTGSDAIRLLYVGRLQELKGVRPLVEAVVGSDLPVVLRLAGGDTDTAPGGGSMLEHLEHLARGDRRLSFLGRLTPTELDLEYAAADVVVLPSRFESHGYVLREALARGLPVLATPAAGYRETIGDGRTGWTTEGFDATAIRDGLRQVVEERDRLDELLATGAPRAALAEGLDPDAWAQQMLSLLAPATAGRTRPGGADRVTAVVLAGRGDLERTVRSLTRQDGVELEVVVAATRASEIAAGQLEAVGELVICDPDDALTRALDVRSNDGPVLVLRAGETVVPLGVARLLDALAEERVTFATGWGVGSEPCAHPVGGPEARGLTDFGVAASVALLTAEAASLAAGHGTDPAAWLTDGGHLGVVVPEVLFGLPARRPVRDREAAAARSAGESAAAFELWGPSVPTA